MTNDLNRDKANTDYLSFDIPAASTATLYIAYDAAATTLPTWLDSYTDTGLQLTTDNPAAPIMQLYSLSNVSGNVVLEGANASVNGASSNYTVIVVPN